MRNAILALVAVCCPGLAQTGDVSPEQIKAQMDSELRRDPATARPFNETSWPPGGPSETLLNPPLLTRERPASGTVSVHALRHKIPEAAKKAFEQAARLSQAGDLEAAVEHLRQALALDPGFAEAHINLGAAYFKLGRDQEAETELERAIELNPVASAAHSNLAATQTRLGKLAEAEASARRALELSGTNVRAHYVLGLILSQNAETREEGLRELELAARTIPAAEEALQVLRQR